MAYEMMPEGFKPPSSAGQYEMMPDGFKPPVDDSRSGFVDGANALGTGYLRGITRLVGMPVDAVANVLDLGKAALGAPYIAMTGKEPPDWLQLKDRSNVTGSGDNLLKNAGSTKVGDFLVNPQNPAYEGGYAQTIGGGLSGVVRPDTLAQTANQATNSALSAVAGKAVYDVTGNTALSIAAGMSPTAAQSAVIGTGQRVIRGGEDGRKVMAQRIQDLKNAGVENPTLGLASGNAVIGGVENLLQNTPGAVNVMRNSRNAAINGLDETTNNAAALSSLQRGAWESGRAIQSGIKDFKDNFKTTQTDLYNKLDPLIPGQTPTNVAGTKSLLAGMNADIPGALELSQEFKNARIASIGGAMQADTVGNSPGLLLKTTGSGGLLNSPVTKVIGGVPAGPSTDALPFQAVKPLRTLVGNQIADGGLMDTVPRNKWRALYGGLSDDMQTVATQSGPEAAQAFNRATDYTRSGIARLDRVAPFADMPTPEKAYTALVQSANENVSTLQAVKKTLPEGARGAVAGTVIERLGKANNGVQNENGTVWSPETFLTNWNKMRPQARDELFSGFNNSSQVYQDVSAVARASSMMRDNSKLWANPSGTGANVAARGMLGAIAAGGAGAIAGLLNPLVPLGAAAGLGATNLLARGLTSSRMVNGAAKSIFSDPRMLNSQANSQANSLIGSGLLNQPD